MAWKGFVKESKSYMNHPDYWHEYNANKFEGDGGWTINDKRRTKLEFWLAFPRAFIRFYWFELRDQINRWVLK